MVINFVKRESLSICISQGWLSNKESNLWYIDPSAALENFSVTKKLHFILNLLTDFAVVGFSDGAWSERRSKGGIGGVLYSNICSLTFACSGSAITRSALGAEVEACKYMWSIMEKFEKKISKNSSMCRFKKCGGYV